MGIVLQYLRLLQFTDVTDWTDKPRQHHTVPDWDTSFFAVNIPPHQGPI